MDLKLLESMKNLPNRHGVYWFKDTEDNVIFVGRAKDMKTEILTKLDPTSNKYSAKVLETKSI